MQKYNFFTWWLSFSIKPLPYKIFKGIITSAVFIIWVAFVAVFTDLYWKFTVFVFLPVFIVDTVWEIINFTRYRKKYIATLQERDGNKDDLSNNS
ncbi:MAG: hypothetical protein HFE34_00760 [Clostridia bacterium]|jgi:hypothetical protein|nr:hypothetical protein [Clostridia bacterium]